MDKLFSFVIFFVACSAAMAQDSWTLVTANFQSRPVRLLSIDASGVKAIDAGGGPPAVVSLNNVLELDSEANKPSPVQFDYTLYLNGGDSIGGSALSMHDDTLTWRHPLLGQLDISEDQVNAIVRGGQTIDGLDEPRKTDAVRLTNGDITYGVLQAMTDSTVTILPVDADSPARIGLDKVAAILLADSDPRASSGTSWRITLTDGSTLSASSAQLSQGARHQLTVSLGGGKTTPIDLTGITCIEQINGPVRWLTSLTPQQVVYRPFLGEDFPPRFDHPVDDPSVSIRAKFPPFHHGIGVHSYTKLKYAVPAQFHAFRTQFALERIAGSDERNADVAVRIYLDGKLAQEFPHVRYNSPGPPVLLDVSNKADLSLEVDYGDAFSAQGRFVWLDPAFLRVMPSQ